MYTLHGHFMERKIDVNEQTMKETTSGVICYGVSCVVECESHEREEGDTFQSRTLQRCIFDVEQVA